MDNINDIEVNNPEFVIKKQTAVEFLHSEYKKIIGDTQVTFSQMLKITDTLEQAKEMEKQQIIDAYDLGSLSDMQYPNPKTVIENGKQYYNETFNI
jgi:hypothetical protein